MRIFDVPAALQAPGHRYPPHNEGLGLECYVSQYMRQHAAAVDTDWIYLPVHWTNNYVRARDARPSADLRAMPEHQALIDTLLPSERYFTVVQCDNGVYEDLPPNVLVFGAGGEGDIPIPLLADPHPIVRGGQRRRMASFLGGVECGGPPPGKLKESLCIADGGGARIRRRMWQAFVACPNCTIVQGNYGTEAFREILSDSVFALAPRGYGKTSFRLYEAMDLGCIPVYFYDELWLPYQDKLPWREFALLCPPDDIEQMPAILAAAPAAWCDKARRVAATLYADYFTLAGMSKQILQMILART